MLSSFGKACASGSFAESRKPYFKSTTYDIVIFIVSFLFMCTPSAVIHERGVKYNLIDEGFLDQNLLQVIGRAARPSDQSMQLSKQLCLKTAKDLAEEKALRVFLHTKFRLPSSYSQTRGFDSDYGFPLTSRDLILARSTYSDLLARGYIALQDTRSKEECTLILRIEGSDLPYLIRNQEVNFTPEKMK